LRLDPFFMDVPREVETRATRRIAFQAPGTNTLDGVNILSIIVELDVATVLGRAPGTLFAVAVETVTEGLLPMRLERLGRPELKNILLSENREVKSLIGFWGDLAARRSYLYGNRATKLSKSLKNRRTFAPFTRIFAITFVVDSLKADH
jgi:hypothetical protein